MYYHVVIETTEKVGKNNKNKEHYELDKSDLDEIATRIVRPYLDGEDFQFDGYFLKKQDIRRISIKQTERSTHVLAKYENDHTPSDIIVRFVGPEDILNFKAHAQDITTKVFDDVKAELQVKGAKKQVKGAKKAEAEHSYSRVFVVHGRDDLVKTEAARFIEKLGLEAVILHEQASAGKTIIEKIEEHTNVGFAIVLYTPCDFGGLAGQSATKPRARQNVVFEHGYLIGKLGRHNVCALVKGEVEIPNDISGVVYISLDAPQAWHLALAKELRNAGYPIDMNRLL